MYFRQPTTYLATELHTKFQFIKPIHVVLTPPQPIGLRNYTQNFNLSSLYTYFRSTGRIFCKFLLFYLCHNIIKYSLRYFIERFVHIAICIFPIWRINFNFIICRFNKQISYRCRLKIKFPYFYPFISFHIAYKLVNVINFC